MRAAKFSILSKRRKTNLQPSACATCGRWCCCHDCIDPSRMQGRMLQALACCQLGNMPALEASDQGDNQHRLLLVVPFMVEHCAMQSYSV